MRHFRGVSDAIDPSRALGGYAAITTLALAWIALGAASAPRDGAFRTLDVKGINVREADGTGSPKLDRRDAAGRIRLSMNVAAHGAATIEFRDAAGRVTKSLTP